MTHERGHAAGAHHVNENDHPWHTMSPIINGPCQTSERTLAYGEAVAFNLVY